MNEKKSERLEVRLGYQEKQNFTEACDTQGDTPSGAVRRFIKGYVRRSDEDLLHSAWRGAAKRRSARPVIFGLIFIGLAGLFWGLSHRFPIISDDTIFAARDINADGQLELAEIGIPPRLGDEPIGVMRVLDLDGSGSLSREEFVQKGRMVYAVAPKEKAGEAALASGEKVRMTLVEFEFSKDRTQSETFENAVVNAEKLDRLVLWQADGTTTVFEGHVNIKSGSTLTIDADDAAVSQ